MLMRISVFESPQLQATMLALRGMDRELAAQIRKATKTVTVNEWRAALAPHATTPLEKTVLVGSARVAVTNKNVSLKSGQLAKKLSSGAPLYSLTRGTEFGSTPRQITTSSSTGKSYKRSTGAPFRARKQTGYVAYPAAADVIPRIAALWVATVVRTFHEALDEGAQ